MENKIFNLKNLKKVKYKDLKLKKNNIIRKKI
jgi:hypothetical protein